MDVALKEWASVIDELGRGRQIMLLRKGGIVEAARQGFELRHREFLLFPTYEHQNVHWMKPGHDVPPQPHGIVPIRYLAQVTSVFPAPSIDVLRKASDAHLWNDEFIQMRYNYRPDLPLLILLVRVLRLPQEQSIADRPSYAGCKSWVNLSETIDPSKAVPVLGDAEYRETQDALRIRLCASSL